jgi:hypothetical protein
MAAGLARANGVIFTAMPLALAQVHRLLVADRARDAGVIRRAIAEVLAANPEQNRQALITPPATLT